MPKSNKTEFIINGEKVVIERGVKDDKTSTDNAPKPKRLKEEKRDRKFCLTSYIDRNYLYQFLKRAEWIQHWAMCTHNSDVNDDGTLKEEHTHIVLYTYNAKTSSAVKKLFDRYSAEIYKDCEIEPQNTLCQICFDVVSQWRYLIHADDKEKYQYSDADRYCDNFSYWNKLDKSARLNDSADNIALAMLEDYMNGVHPLEMTRRYGKDYMYHISHLQKCAWEIYKKDGLTRESSLDIKEYAQLCLANSPLKAEVIANFWVALDYIVSQCRADFNSQIEFYLPAINERN